MFKKNVKHKQADIFGFSSIVSQHYADQLSSSQEQTFYDLIFSKIREEDFSCLFSEEASRPNAPINCLVASLLMKSKKNWTDKELFQNIQFNLLTKVALGLQKIDEMPFSPATFYNLQIRLQANFIATGENLLEKMFDGLTQDQLKELKIKTDIQRTDSFQAMSNIRRYSRLQLLIEMLIRVYRVLTEGDCRTYDELFSPYVRKTSGQFMYHLQQDTMQQEFEKIGNVYRTIFIDLYPRYQNIDIFATFERVYTEHFTVVEEKIALIDTTMIPSSALQSPDDIDATYRKKNNTGYRGYAVNITETCNPENDLNLITDVVTPNNIDDSKILHERLDIIKEKTPDLVELHNDGAYGSADNDVKCAELGITQIVTAIRGRDAAVDITIDQIGDDVYSVSCPHQTATARKGPKKYQAAFNTVQCIECPLRERCTLKMNRAGTHRYFSFSEKDVMRKQRARNIKEISPERRSLRPNVEATVSEFTRKMPDDKVRVRGLFRTAVFAVTAAVGINFGRIVRYLDDLMVPETGSFSAA